MEFRIGSYILFLIMKLQMIKNQAKILVIRCHEQMVIEKKSSLILLFDALPNESRSLGVDVQALVSNYC